MGRDKALIELEGRAMAARVADALVTAGAGTVCAVGGDGAALAAAGLDVLADDHPGEGPLGGVLTALRDRAMRPPVAVLACDLLRPDPDTIVQLVIGRDIVDADVAVPTAEGRPQWTHAVWHPRVHGVLAALFRAGERSIVGAVSGLRVQFVDLADARVTADADSPADLLGPAGA